MHTPTKKLVWTVALVLFLTFAVLARLQWLGLLVPGAVLVWYGLVARAPQRRIALQKPGRSGLH
jgi:hypothetical protein